MPGFVPGSDSGYRHRPPVIPWWGPHDPSIITAHSGMGVMTRITLS